MCNVYVQVTHLCAEASLMSLQVSEHQFKVSGRYHVVISAGVLI